MARTLPLRLEGEAAGGGTTRVLSLKQPKQRFIFVDVPATPVPSLLRGFSAPVMLQVRLHRRRAHASDGARQRRLQPLGSRPAAGAQRSCCAASQGSSGGRQPEFPGRASRDAFARVLADGARDPAFAAEALSLPSEGYIAEQMDVVDPDAIHAVRVALRRYLARALRRRVARGLSRFRRAPARTARTRARRDSARCATCAWAT